MKTLATTFYRPETEMNAVMIVVHGMAEHRKRYDAFAKAMNRHGIGVLLYDQRGHGESVKDASDLGYFGHSDGWMNLISDLDGLIDELKQASVPVLLFGHSMGSMVARCYAKRHDEKIDALILSGAPNFTPAAPLGRTVAKLIAGLSGEKKRSALLHNMAEGGFIKAIENPKTELDWLSYDEGNVTRYIADPLCGFSFTNRGYQDLMSLMVDMHDIKGWSKKHAKLPILFVSGKDDPCTGSDAGLTDSIDVLKQAGYSKIENIVYENARHEILNEKIACKVMDDISSWIKKVL